MQEKKTPFGASCCGRSVVAPKKEDDYSSEEQLNPNWRDIASKTPTFLPHTEDHDA
ncbi:MAG: hypothetical protein ABIA02_03660 [Candidatus Falkowbacteria bacterium]